MTDPKPTGRSAWAWIPSLYFAEGLPYVAVMAVAVLFYKDLGVSNLDIAYYTSWLYLPWVIKPLWSPVVELLRTRRWWIWTMQVVVGAGFAGVALAIPSPHFFQLTLAFFWLVAFASATHDIAADGFYMLATTEREQAGFSGVRNTFYRVATIAGQGLLVMAAGKIQERTGSPAFAWSLAFAAPALLLVLLGAYHWRALPRPANDRRANAGGAFAGGFVAAFGTFFRKPKIVALLAFLLLYRFGEAQLVKLVGPFLRDPRAVGGLGLTTEQVGLIYGTTGVVALMSGGLLGGYVISRRGLKFWLWPMVMAIHLPDAVFVWLAHAQPENLGVIGACVAVEQFGYGFGFAAFMVYMIYIARGENPTAHYAICTGFMALGMMLPGMFSGGLQQAIGYEDFFVEVLKSTVPSILVVLLIPLDAEFGRKG